MCSVQTTDGMKKFFSEGMRVVNDFFFFFLLNAVRKAYFYLHVIVVFVC